MSNAYAPAFPIDTVMYRSPGLSKREYFAAMAMQGIVSQWQHDWFPKDHAKLAVELADALLAELERTA